MFEEADIITRYIPTLGSRYRTLGSSLVMNVILNAVTPHIYWVILWGVKLWKWKHKRGRALSQEVLNNLTKGLRWEVRVLSGLGVRIRVRAKGTGRSRVIDSLVGTYRYFQLRARVWARVEVGVSLVVVGVHTSARFRRMIRRARFVEHLARSPSYA